MSADTPPAIKPTILVVDDEEPIRLILRTALEMSGHHVLVAGDAEEALGLCERHAERIDLVITDVLLPGITGNDMVRRLAPSRPGLHVLYISGYLGGETDLAGADGGKTRYLPKPFTPRELLAAVHDLLAV